MKIIFREINRLLHAGESFVLATIFEQSGSAPRMSGAKMLVRADGTISGTIGGGRLEADAMQAAREVLLSGQPKIWSFQLTGEDVAGMDMICGGQGQVLLDFIDSTDATNLRIYEEANAILEMKGKGWLITTLDNLQNTDRRQCLIKRDGTVIGRCDGGPQLLSQLISGTDGVSVRLEEIDNRKYLVEPLRNAGTIYIFGAGHVSQKIAPLSETVGFKTVVLDDRAEYANRERFPAASEITLLESFDRLPEFAVDEDGYIVIVTRGHLHDKTILAWALKTKAGYIGMIGSRRKRDKIFEALAAEGFGKQDFDRVYSPIGTDIGADTPEELAVSIVGELIKIRAEKAKCL
jgi:xanthine dehydrogenase accessory factor